MTKIGQIKKEKVNFNMVRTPGRSYGRGTRRSPQKGHHDKLAATPYYDKLNSRNKQVKPFFGVRKITDSVGRKGTSPVRSVLASKKLWFAESAS
jgi:hypothetical protein